MCRWRNRFKRRGSGAGKINMALEGGILCEFAFGHHVLVFGGGRCGWIDTSTPLEAGVRYEGGRYASGTSLNRS